MNRKTEYARHKREKKWWSAIRGRGADGAVCACLYTEMLGVEVVVLFLSGVSSVDSAAVIDERVYLWKIYAGI